MIDTPNSDFIPALLAWFEQTAEDLPWRRTDNPYYIWLSEIMLQQTQVTTVIPYYERFIQKFPTIEDLAKAPQDELMKQWEGLGYYSRARNLQIAAQQIIQDYGGQLPTSAETLEKLRGIGRYTAGAIASITFDEHVPVVDGNVIRVFSRLFDIADDVSSEKTKKALWQLAENLMHAVPQGKAGDYNQAVMELGREVCKPRNPLCGFCPIADFCRAKQNQKQAERPVKKPKKVTPHYDVTCGLIWNQHRHLLIAKRRNEDLLGGLWEFPGGKIEEDETLEDCLVRELYEELGIQVEVGELFIRVQHAYTHFKITLHAFECTYLPEGGDPQALQCADWRWVSAENLAEYAFSSADRKVISALLERPKRLF
jgi:A/G-specific adenine glycosylase